MNKSILTTVIAVILLFSAAFAENKKITNTFDGFYSFLEQTEIKLIRKQFNLQDACALKDYWLTQKRTLHIWIPHNEIKEIDLWLGETVAYTQIEKYDEALTKIQVLKLLCKQIPTTFSLKPENIF